MKVSLFEEYADLFEAEKIDPKEYDYEGEMAKGQLLTMADAAAELHDMLEDTENLPEWCQNKISKATDYIDSVRDYMIAKKSKDPEIDAELDDLEKESVKEMKVPKSVNKMANQLAKKVKDMKKEGAVDEISVAARNKYYDDAKKDIERAKSSAVGKILRGKEADGTRHDHSIELRRIAKREKGIKTAKDQAIKNIRGELYGKKKKNESVDEIDEKFSIKLPPVRGGKKILNVSMGRAIKMLKDFGATKSDMRNVLSGKGGRFQNAGGEMFLVQRESVNEISKKTAGSYIKKRIYDVGSAAGRMGADFGIGPEEKKKNREKAVRQYVKYQKGMNRATDKLTGKAKVPATEAHVDTEVKKTPVGERPKGKGWSLKKAGIITGKDHDVWHRQFKSVPPPKMTTSSPMYNSTNESINPTLEQWKQKLSESLVIEKLKVSDGMGAWVDDFKNSDAPQFKGKNTEERRDMAIAAYLSAKRGDQND